MPNPSPDLPMANPSCRRYNEYSNKEGNAHDEPHDGGMPRGGAVRLRRQQPLQDTGGRRIPLGARRTAPARLGGKHGPQFPRRRAQEELYERPPGAGSHLWAQGGSLCGAPGGATARITATITITTTIKATATKVINFDCNNGGYDNNNNNNNNNCDEHNNSYYHSNIHILAVLVATFHHAV